jgi:hypothetical protein
MNNSLKARTHFLVNMICNTVFSALFAKIHNLVPDKKVLNRLYYDSIMVSIPMEYQFNLIIQ